MKAEFKRKARYWSGLTLTAAVLILFGILTVLTTFVTIIGPILGLTLVAGGVYLLTLATQAKKRGKGIHETRATHAYSEDDDSRHRGDSRKSA